MLKDSRGITAFLDAMVFMGIWKAYVDGKETEILRANYAFMGLNLSEGHHEIVLKYHVPYLTEGIIVSLVSLCITVIILVVTKKKTSQKKA